jgi:hypothetical protein
MNFYNKIYNKMKKNIKIIYEHNMLEELLQVIKLCSQKHGIGNGEFAYVIITYFKKWGITKLGYTNDFIDLKLCTINVNDNIFTVNDIKNDLLLKGYLVYNNIQAKNQCDENLWHNDEKTIPYIRKMLLLQKTPQNLEEFSKNKTNNIMDKELKKEFEQLKKNS